MHPLFIYYFVYSEERQFDARACFPLWCPKSELQTASSLKKKTVNFIKMSESFMSNQHQETMSLQNFCEYCPAYKRKLN